MFIVSARTVFSVNFMIKQAQSQPQQGAGWAAVYKAKSNATTNTVTHNTENYYLIGNSYCI